jgi:hypothetical protein
MIGGPGISAELKVIVTNKIRVIPAVGVGVQERQFCPQKVCPALPLGLASGRPMKGDADNFHG